MSLKIKENFPVLIITNDNIKLRLVLRCIGFIEVSEMAQVSTPGEKKRSVDHWLLAKCW